MLALAKTKGLSVAVRKRSLNADRETKVKPTEQKFPLKTLTKSAVYNAKGAHDFVQLRQHFLNLMFEFDTNTAAFVDELSHPTSNPSTLLEEFLR
jgi:hypothetical protein